MNTLKVFFFLLSDHEKKQSSLLLIMTITMALLDTLGIASILPFIAVLTNPNLIETNNILNNVFEISKSFGVDTNQDFFFFLGTIVFFF